MSLFKKLIGLASRITNTPADAEASPPPDLEAWNAVGRSKSSATCQTLAAIIDDDASSDDDLTEDSRSEALADAVLEQVVAFNAAGEWHKARTCFDPAHGPFLPHMNQTGLKAVVVLGKDRFLVQRGTEVLHLNDDSVETVPDCHGFAISRDRRWLALAKTDGVAISRGYDDAPSSIVPWPAAAPVDPDSFNSFDIANDGQSLVFASDDVGVWLLQSATWLQLAPRPGIGDDRLNEDDEDDDEEDQTRTSDQSAADACAIQIGTYAELRARFGSEIGLDLCHAALSPDGKWIAYGWQDAYSGHYVDRIENGELIRVGNVAPQSDYPYAVKFTDDNQYLLSNSRHRVSGCTVCCEPATLKLDDEDSSDNARTTDDYLRAYALCLLPGAAFGLDEPVAWIGGAGWSHAAPLSGGKPVFTHFFGSALRSIDYDPVSQRVAVASASGMLHIMAPFAEAELGRERGYHPRQELYRWIFWDTLQVPIRW